MNTLVTAIGSMSAMEVVHRLSAASGVKVFGCDIYPATWLPAASGLEAFVQVPRAVQAQDYVQALLGFCDKHKIAFVIPLTDTEVDVLSGYRQAFASRGVMLCIPGEACVSLCRDKLQVHDLFQHDSKVVPIDTRALQAWMELDCPFPLIAKPRRGRSSEGILRLTDRAGLEACLRHEGATELIVQPLLEGAVYVADVLRDAAADQAVVVCRRELLRTSNGAGLTVALCPDPELEQLAVHAARRLGLNGCINLEFIRCAGAYRLMDVNPRFSAGVAFSRLAGYDMVLNALRLFSGQPIDCAVAYGSNVITRHYLETLTSAEEGHDDR